MPTSIKRRRNAGKLFQHVHEPAAETHRAIAQGEQGEIPAHADIVAGLYAACRLALDDAAGPDDLAAGDLDPAILGVRVAAITGRTLSFFMCHKTPSKIPAAKGSGHNYQFYEAPQILLGPLVGKRQPLSGEKKYRLGRAKACREKKMGGKATPNEVAAALRSQGNPPRMPPYRPS